MPEVSDLGLECPNMTQVWVNWVAIWDVGWAHKQQDSEPEKVNEMMKQDKKTEQQDGDAEHQDDAEAEQQDEQPDEQEENVGDKQQDQEGDEDNSNSLLVPAQQQDQIIKDLEAARAKLKDKIAMYKKEQVRVTNELHEQHVLIATLKSQNEGLKEQLELLKSEHANWRKYESLKGTSTTFSKHKNRASEAPEAPEAPEQEKYQEKQQDDQEDINWDDMTTLASMRPTDV
eukprot:m51a1_g3512 hypothetical protein (230) ;mRNA; f:888311-896174